MKYAISTITDNNNINQTIFFLNSFKKYNSWFGGDILIIQKDYEPINNINQQRIINVFENNIVRFISSEKWTYKEIIKSKYPNDYKYANKFNEIVYCKLEILDLLSEYDKIVYFDTDIIINKNLSILFQKNNFDLECSIDTYLDPYIQEEIYNNVDKLDINNIYEDAKYFCAGFMVFNKNLKNEFYEFLNNKILDNNIYDDPTIYDYQGYKHKFLDYGEQDLFNLFYRSNDYKINYLPIKYHFLLRDLEKINDINDCAIIHYTHLKLHKDINKALKYDFYIDYFKELFPTYIICEENISEEYKNYYINLGFKDVLNDINLLPKTSYYIILKNEEYLKLNKSLFEIIYNMFYNQINKLNLLNINKTINGPEQNIFINEMNESNLIVVNHKIDYILSYIDFEQPEIQDLWNKTTNIPVNNLTRNYTYLDLEMTLKLILKNLPFINKLYITCKDVQRFPDNIQRLIDNSNGRIVRMNESNFMPNNYITFSASCIEMFLWKIPGLSEYFIYGNDDMIPLKPLNESHFFKDDKLTIGVSYGHNSLYSIYDVFLSNATNLVLNHYQSNGNYKDSYYPQHTLRPLTKTICQECYNKYKNFIDHSLTPTRFYNNLNIDLFLIYALKNNYLINKSVTYKFKYIESTNIKGLQSIYNNLNNKLYNEVPHIICINDSAESNNLISLTKNVCYNILTKSLNTNYTIPKRIYQIWLKKNLSDEIPQKSKEFMDNVKKWCSENDYEYILIDNNSDIYKECINTSLFCKTQLKFWHSCALSDYIRLYVLNKYGGIYLDSDVKIHKGFDELLNNEYFICCEPQNWKGNKIFGRIDCGTMASLPNNELYQIIINIFDKCLYNCYLGTDDITKYLRNNYNINGNYKIWIAIPEIVPFVIEKIMKKQIVYINEPNKLNITNNTFDIYDSHFFSDHGRYVEHCFHTTWL